MTPHDDHLCRRPTDDSPARAEDPAATESADPDAAAEPLDDVAVSHIAQRIAQQVGRDGYNRFTTRFHAVFKYTTAVTLLFLVAQMLLRGFPYDFVDSLFILLVVPPLAGFLAACLVNWVASPWIARDEDEEEIGEDELRRRLAEVSPPQPAGSVDPDGDGDAGTTQGVPETRVEPPGPAAP
jgi:hypothetical protein